METKYEVTLEEYFISVCDIMPECGGRGKHGLDAMPQAFSSLTWFLMPNTIDFLSMKPRIGHAHAPETYMEWLNATIASDLLTREQLIPELRGIVACPVDVEVFNNTGVLVGKTVNNVPDESLNGEVNIFVNEDIKNIYMPSYGTYTIKMIGTDTGKMDYMVESFDVLTGETISQKSFQGVNIASGKIIASQISGIDTISDIKLSVRSENNDVIAEISTDGIETPTSHNENKKNDGNTGTGVGRGDVSGGMPTEDSLIPLSPAPEVIETENPFNDIKPSDWFYENVIDVYKKGLFLGTSERVFSPNLPISRGAAITVLGRLHGVDVTRYENLNSNFTDVSQSAYYTPYVAWGSENSIVLGTGDRKFSPSASMTRQDLTVILQRYSAFAKNEPVIAQAFNLPYSDTAKISKYAMDSVAWATQNSIVNGKSNNIFDPFGITTRAEFATIIKRFIDIQ